MNMKKEIITKITCAIITIGLILSLPLSVRAEENATFSEEEAISGNVMTLTTPGTAYREANESSEIVAEFAAGDSVFVVSKDGDWIQIFYRGENLYLKTNEGSASEQVVQPDDSVELAKALEEEFSTQEAELDNYTDAMMRQESAKKNAMIWKIVIAVLVVLIIVVSVIIGVKSSKSSSEEKSKEKPEDK